jgi:hypothetical protein
VRGSAGPGAAQVLPEQRAWCTATAGRWAADGARDAGTGQPWPGDGLKSDGLA